MNLSEPLLPLKQPSQCFGLDAVWRWNATLALKGCLLPQGLLLIVLTISHGSRSIFKRTLPYGDVLNEALVRAFSSEVTSNAILLNALLLMA